MGTTPNAIFTLLTRQHYEALEAACRAALAYDEAIRGAATELLPGLHDQAGLITRDVADLDALYERWLEASRRALAMAGTQPLPTVTEVD